MAEKFTREKTVWGWEADQPKNSCVECHRAQEEIRVIRADVTALLKESKEMKTELRQLKFLLMKDQDSMIVFSHITYLQK